MQQKLLFTKNKKYWYKMYVGWCPVCGRDASYRVRVYGEKPTNPEERYVYLADSETYDSCIKY